MKKIIFRKSQSRISFFWAMFKNRHRFSKSNYEHRKDTKSFVSPFSFKTLSFVIKNININSFKSVRFRKSHSLFRFFLQCLMFCPRKVSSKYVKNESHALNERTLLFKWASLIKKNTIINPLKKFLSKSQC